MHEKVNSRNLATRWRARPNCIIDFICFFNLKGFTLSSPRAHVPQRICTRNNRARDHSGNPANGCHTLPCETNPGAHANQPRPGKANRATSKATKADRSPSQDSPSPGGCSPGFCRGWDACLSMSRYAWHCLPSVPVCLGCLPQYVPLCLALPP